MPFKSYEALQILFDGEVDAAWRPPVLCAPVESGGVIAHRAIRRGGTTYRSALIIASRTAGTSPSSSRVRSVAHRPRVAPHRAGNLLPRGLLVAQGIDLETQLLNQRWLGSHTACFESLNQYDADLTSFIRVRGLEAVWGPRVERLQIIALSDECPNDGIVLSPNPEICGRPTTIL